MGASGARTSGQANSEEEVGLDWTHPPEAGIQYHARKALTWNPQGKRKRGRPRKSWRRDTEAELKQQGTNWTGATAQNRVHWRRVVDGLCSIGSDGPE